MRLIIKTALTAAMMICCGVYSLQARERLTLEECLEAAAANSPSLRARDLETERARILKGTAFDTPNTEVTLKQETTGGGGPENGVAFSQEFDFPTVYVARHRSLDARYKLEKTRYEVEMASLRREVAGAYQNLLYITEMIKLKERLADAYDEFYEIASRRFEEGEGSRLELINAESVKERNCMELASLRASREAGERMLGMLTGTDEAVAPAEEEITLSAHGYSRGGYDFGSTPEGRLFSQGLDVADREIALEKNRFLPGIRIGATTQALIRSFNPYHIEKERFGKGNFMGFEVGITVPLFFGAQKSRLQAALLDRQLSIAEGERLDREGSLEFDRLVEKLSLVGERIHNFQSISIPRAKEMERLSDVSYRLGEISYLEYIGNVAEAFSVYENYVETVRDYNLIILDLDKLTGR